MPDFSTAYIIHTRKILKKKELKEINNKDGYHCLAIHKLEIVVVAGERHGWAYKHHIHEERVDQLITTKWQGDNGYSLETQISISRDK